MRRLLSCLFLSLIAWTAPAVGKDAEPPPAAPDPVDGAALVRAALKPDTSDLPGIRERGFLRFAIAPDPLLIVFDGEEAVGVAAELARELEAYLKTLDGAGATPVVVVPLATPRTRVADRIEEGRADFSVLVVTEEREGRLDFTEPLISEVADVVVLGPEAPSVGSLDELAEVPVYVTTDGRYARKVEAVNAAREAEGKPPLDIRFVDERLDDYDLVEMVEVGLIPATVVTDFKAAFWGQVYRSVTVREDLALGPPRDIAWAVRPDNPKLREALNGFARKVREGTLLGNILLDRYFGSTGWIENLDTDDRRSLIGEVRPVIERHAQASGFEPDLILAQAYQESKLDQSKRSPVGAVGVMQVLPATARDPSIGIPNVHELEDNVRAGVKYLRWLIDTWFDEPEIPPLDQTLFALAAYNAGPGGVARARERARAMGLDPNVWFENVELAIQRAVSREPAIYVRNIFKYYVAYRLLQDLESRKEAAQAAVDAVEAETSELPPEKRIEALEEKGLVLDEGDVPPAE